MPDFAQQAHVQVAGNPALGQCMPVIGIIAALYNDVTPVSFSQPSIFGSIVQAVIAGGANQVLMAGAAGQHIFMHHLRVKSSAAVEIKGQIGADFFFDWTFTAGETIDIHLGTPGYMLPNAGLSGVIVNGGGVNTTVDAMAWYSLS